MKGLEGDNAIPQNPEPEGSQFTKGSDNVQPIGHPMSHSTNAGFNRRREERPPIEDLSPPLLIILARGPDWQACKACSFKGLELAESVSSEASSLFQSRAFGVAHRVAMVFEDGRSLTVGVGHLITAPVSITSPFEPI
jgi:hypothetical protein